MSDPKSIPSLPEPPPEEFPRLFGHYTLLAPLARGGMGEVFLAKTGGVAGLEKRCVVKTLRPHLTDDREYVARFVDEARIVVQLGHRNICQVFDVGVVGERYYLAMEYIAGRDVKSLQSRIEDGALERGIAIHIMGEVLEALDYAHRHVDAATGQPLLLVHRDISPQNVMLSFEGEVKLIDFGLAASTMKLEQTQPNVVMGKLAYMAPEQVRGDKVDGRVDLFAVGVCLYELLVGERFYEGRSPYEIWGIAAQGGFRPRKWDTLPPVLRAILDKALAANVADRFATGLEMRAALESYRFENGLRGDSPALREQMQRLFVPEIDENRRLLQLLATTKRTGDSGPQTTLPSQEPTMSIARAMSGPIVHKDATEPTQMMIKRTFEGRRRTVRVAALLSAAVVSAAIAFLAKDAVLSLLRPPPLDVAGAVSGHVRPVAQPVADRAVLAVAGLPAASADAGPAAAVESPVETAPVETAAVDTPAIDTPAIDTPAVEDKKPRKRWDDKKPKKKSEPVVADKPTVQPEVVQTAAAAKAEAPSYGSLSTRGKRIDALREHCSAPCVADVKRSYDAKDWAEPELLAPFSAALKSCWFETCKLPE